ncbi:MAG: hypothetical protein JXB48_11085 [Candidatus Latescibacteria bacterium]|nr:hypothetical protein [Candidatus Latescibacterota bacterium]
MKNKLLILIVVTAVNAVFAKESKLLSYLGNFVPSLTEVGILTNCVNVYDKVSNFVRTTNKLVHSVKRAKSDWDRIRNNIEQIYEDVKYLKEIDPYDMDTWQSGLTNFSFSLKFHESQAINAFEMLEAHTLGASENYVKRIQSIGDYRKTFENKKSAVRNLYTHSSYHSRLDDAAGNIRTYRINTIGYLRSLQSADLLIIETTDDQFQRECAQDHFEELDLKIKSLEESITSENQLEKPDSVIDQTANLIAINLTEIKVSIQRIDEMRKASENLVSAYYRLLGQNVNSLKKNELESLPQIPIDPSNFDPSNPDKVAAPVTPDVPLTESEVSKKSISNHDIVSLYNGASFLALKQESLKRDMVAMKINTMAFIVAMEALRRNNTEASSVAFAHSCRMVEIVMEELQ